MMVLERKLFLVPLFYLFILFALSHGYLQGLESIAANHLEGDRLADTVIGESIG